MSNRNIPAELRRAVLVESGHRCAISTCRQTQVEVHHIIPWEKCKSHEFENLITLCPNCHTRAHSGEIDRKSLQKYKKQLSVDSVNSVCDHGVISSGTVFLKRSEGVIHKLIVAGNITIDVGEWQCITDSMILKISLSGPYSTVWKGFTELPFSKGFRFKRPGISVIKIEHYGGETFFKPISEAMGSDG